MIKFKRNDKAKRQTQHLIRRAIERFSVELTPNDIDHLRGQIRKQKAEFLRRQSNRVTVWKIDLKGNEVVAFYDKQRHTVVTLIPLEWELENHKQNEKLNS